MSNTKLLKYLNKINKKIESGVAELSEIVKLIKKINKQYNLLHSCVLMHQFSKVETLSGHDKRSVKDEISRIVSVLNIPLDCDNFVLCVNTLNRLLITRYKLYRRTCITIKL